MRPSEFDQQAWTKGGRNRAWVVKEVRRRPPTGLSPLHDAFPVRTRRRSPWLNLTRRVLLDRDGQRCAGCHVEAPNLYAALHEMSVGGHAEFWLEVDHVVPLTDDGEHALGNMQLLCPRCHRAKNRIGGHDAR